MNPDDLLNGRLKLRHLVLLTALADHGSLLRAAEHLHVTQPALTRTLRELETLLGVELFERGPRGMTPTVYGRAFAAHARRVLAELRQAGRHLAELADGQVGTVTVGAHLAGTNVLLPRAIAALKAERPRVTVVVREATPDLLEAELLAGDVDFTLGRLLPSPDTRVTQHTLCRESIRLVTRAGHPAHTLGDPALEDLLAYPWVVPVPQTALRHELEEALWRRGLSLPEDRVECTSILTLRTLLLETDMVAALPELVARGDDRLAMLPTALEMMGQTVGVTLPADRPLTLTARLLLRHLRAAAADIRP
ncbi:LysR family transcriptional regulator [Streptomyces sp. NRRL F-4489]|uniref:LysR substrate-binding domain-containing protein n=1 Tax=Streptomyces sp. NRRL F-4489 TaxID=1609095 RepID=UPI0007477B57|nr:LysR substrate-binding domain-containing protein [Streptomyces sp. NRRL F-4489]KUL45992.1 LysR family transcriptional regulator [Streptomyces sp. NRRL F-4489]